MFFLNIVKKDFKYAHTSHMVWKPAYNWIPYFSSQKFKIFFNSFGESKKVYLPQINLFISERSEKNLLSNPPYSTKKWQQAKIIYDSESELKDIQFRYRGDNPNNWSFQKKSIRFKLRKNGMNDRQRYFEYWPFNPETYLSTKLALESDLLISSVRLVEILINNQVNGVFMELEKLDENFLRRNNFMPVNLYKGENYNAEQKIGLDENLYNNPGLWTKTSFFNQKKRNNYEDLQEFLKYLQNAFNSKDAYINLLSFIDIDYWARYSAYLILAQNDHHTSWHNARLIFDPWSGKVVPLITDPDINRYVNTEEKVSKLDYSVNDMIKLLNLNSSFLDKKYYYLNQFLKEKKIINKTLKDFNIEKNILISSLKRDPGLIDPYFLYSITHEAFIDYIEELERRLLMINNTLTNVINIKPNFTFQKNETFLSLNLKGEIAASNLNFHFEGEAPEWLAFDENYNGKIDDSEIKYFSNGQKVIETKVDLYANRIIYSKNKKFRTSQVNASPTKFDLILSNNSNIKKIEFLNKFSNNKYFAEKNLIDGSQTTLHNKIIHRTFKKKQTINVFSKEIIVEGTKIIEEVTTILPGTIFKMKKNSSLIFKNKVIAKGEKNKKIKFINFNQNNTEKWGTVALVGPRSSGSQFNNIEFDGGTGMRTKQFSFTSMLSLHNTKNITIQNSSFKNNSLYDDVLHLVYCDSVLLKNLNFEKAFGDAIDIDISNNIKVVDSKFNSSANDAIDLMQSKATIENNIINFSGDKGISIGEGSIARISDIKFVKNDLAIAVKDGSRVEIFNSKFLNNNKEIYAYKKNWQYGSGGFVSIKNSYFEDSSININSNNRSIINLKDNKFNGKKNFKGKNINLY